MQHQLYGHHAPVVEEAGNRVEEQTTPMQASIFAPDLQPYKVVFDGPTVVNVVAECPQDAIRQASGYTEEYLLAHLELCPGSKANSYRFKIETPGGWRLGKVICGTVTKVV